MHHPSDRIAHTTAFVTPVVKHWLEREIAQWVHPMKDRSDDPSHHERTLLPRSYISLLLWWMFAFIFVIMFKHADLGTHLSYLGYLMFFLAVSDKEKSVMASHLPTGNWSLYRDANPVPNNLSTDDLATAPQIFCFISALKSH